MPFDGSGNYVAAAAPNFPAVGGATIASAYYNATINDIVTALNNCVTRDGQGKVSANIDWNTKNLTNIAALGASAATFTDLTVTNAPTFHGLTSDALATLNGGVQVTGAPTFDAVTAGFSHKQAGAVGYHMYNNGAVNEWLIYQPAHAGGDFLAIASVVTGAITNRVTIGTDGKLNTLFGAVCPNNVRQYFADASGTFANFVCQGDNNFVLYGTDATGAARAIFSVAMRSNTSVPAFTLAPTMPTAAAGTADISGATTAFVDRLRDVPVNIYTVNHNVDASHRGGGADFNGTNLTATIVAGLSDGYTALITNLNATSLTITSASDVLTLAGTTTTGNRTLGQNGMATVRRVNGILLIGGNGLT